MWHVSVKSLGLALSVTSLERYARKELDGHGDASAGEWVEHWPGSAFHLRRRLSVAEAELVGPVIDVRGTPEAERRIRACPWLPPDWSED